MPIWAIAYQHYFYTIRKKNGLMYAGVPRGPTVSRATIEVAVVGSKLARDSFLPVDRSKARERDLAKFGANRRALKRKKKRTVKSVGTD